MPGHPARGGADGPAGRHRRGGGDEARPHLPHGARRAGAVRAAGGGALRRAGHHAAASAPARWPRSTRTRCRTSRWRCCRAGSTGTVAEHAAGDGAGAPGRGRRGRHRPGRAAVAHPRDARRAGRRPRPRRLHHLPGPGPGPRRASGGTARTTRWRPSAPSSRSTWPGAGGGSPWSPAATPACSRWRPPSWRPPRRARTAGCRCGCCRA